MDVTGAMKSFLERLCFPFGSYEHGYRSLAPKKDENRDYLYNELYIRNCANIGDGQC